jgi:hypothetical protein
MFCGRLFSQVTLYLLILLSTNGVTAVPRQHHTFKDQGNAGNRGSPGSNGSPHPIVYPSTWGVNTKDLSHLKPNNNGHLYYTEKGNNSKLLSLTLCLLS